MHVVLNGELKGIMVMQQIYVARRLTDHVMEELQSITDVELFVGEVEPPSRGDLLRNVRGKDALIVTLTERIDEELLEAAGERLKVVANVAVGFDNIDLDACARRGVAVTNTPGVLDGATADHTFALILAVSRRLVEADRFLREGRPWVWGPRMFVGLDVSAGATLAIIGFGRIGRAVARRAQAFDMRVLAVDGSLEVGTQVDGAEVVTLDDALAVADVVTLHVPLLPSTRHLVDAHMIARMKKGAYVINAARGGVVDEAALLRAIRDGHLAGAALDTFENEPDVSPDLLACPEIVLTPHIASAGEQTRDRMCRLAVDNAFAVLRGGVPLTPVQ